MQPRRTASALSTQTICLVLVDYELNRLRVQYHTRHCDLQRTCVAIRKHRRDMSTSLGCVECLAFWKLASWRRDGPVWITVDSLSQHHAVSRRYSRSSRRGARTSYEIYSPFRKKIDCVVNIHVVTPQYAEFFSVHLHKDWYFCRQYSTCIDGPVPRTRDAIKLLRITQLSTHTLTRVDQLRRQRR